MTRAEEEGICGAAILLAIVLELFLNGYADACAANILVGKALFHRKFLSTTGTVFY